MPKEEFIEKVKNNYSEEDANQILKGLSFAEQKHAGQKRDSGEDFVIHPIEVASILVDLTLDKDTIIAGLLHNCLENTDCTEKEIKDNFGEPVLNLLTGIRKLTNIKRSYQRSGEKAENLQKMFLAMGEDARIVLVKLADRLHNMKTLGYKTPEKQQRIARETIDIYVPLAERLGMNIFKREMEDLCFFYLYPEDYKEVHNFIDEYYKKSEHIIGDITGSIKKLAKENSVEARIQSRRKSAFSVFKKWQTKGKDIYDIIALRIIVKNVQDCYTMLGALNSVYKIVDGRNKDYIAHPKPNLYMSLHTTLIYPLEDGKTIPFEVQIRTEQMHQFCEYGVAAHWIYKERGVGAISGDHKQLRKELTKEGELSKIEDNAEQFKDNIQQVFYEGKIFVFTPTLNVIELPKDSIPLDFAYAIHTNLGNKCVGAKINGKMVQLTTPLKTGDVVEIVTSQTGKPSRDWLKKVKSKEAQSKIRNYFKKEQREENIRLGKDMLEDFAKRNGFTLAKLFSDEQNLSALQEKYKLENIEDIYASVGYGRLNSSQVLNKFITAQKQEAKKAKVFEARERKKSSGGVEIGGHKDLLKKFAKCCSPIPGDEIVGYVSRGKGVTIHRKDCPYLSALEDDRKIESSWAITSPSEMFDVNFVVVADNHSNIITSITSKIAESKVDITSITLERTKNEDTNYKISMRVASKKQFIEIAGKLRSLPHVYDVYRL